MGFNVSTLWRSPEYNPINRKARSVPLLNPISVYGRVFFFSWFGFMIAFWSCKYLNGNATIASQKRTFSK